MGYLIDALCFSQDVISHMILLLVVVVVVFLFIESRGELLDMKCVLFLCNPVLDLLSSLLSPNQLEAKRKNIR